MFEKIHFARVAINGIICFRAAGALISAVINLNRGEQGHKANVLTQSYHSLLAIHVFSIFGIFKCTSGSEMPAFFLFLKEPKQIAALTDPDSFSHATTI